jgi:hypothetical protein
MTKLLKELTEFFVPKQQSVLEAFINSKRPTNAAEVEFWTRQYEQAQHWSRGL